MAGAQIEATVDALVTKLTDRLPEKIAELNAEHNDEWILPPPEAVTFGPRSEIPYPWVMVEPAETTNLTQASGRVHYQHSISITAWIAEHDEEGLVRRLVRYQRAIREVALHGWRPGVLGDAAGYGLQFVRDEYGPVLQSSSPTGAPEGGFVAWARSQFAVQQQQDLA